MLLGWAYSPTILDHRQVNQQTSSAASSHSPTSSFFCAFGVMYRVQWCDLPYWLSRLKFLAASLSFVT